MGARTESNRAPIDLLKSHERESFRNYVINIL